MPYDNGIDKATGKSNVIITYIQTKGRQTVLFNFFFQQREKAFNGACVCHIELRSLNCPDLNKTNKKLEQLKPYLEYCLLIPGKHNKENK